MKKRRSASKKPSPHEQFMREALKEAQKGVGRTSPNPAVGAILVKSGKVIGCGHHAKAGAPHAEVVALRKAGKAAKGATLYTTLEPCNHHGKTPPCTDAILAAGIREVVYASVDPNPLVDGSGLKRLKKAKVKVTGAILKSEADALNRPFFKFIQTGLPWLTLKSAMTLDGKLATETGHSRWVSGEASRKYVHEMRNQVDAILVGRGTVAQDDPSLTTRLPSKSVRHPVRVVLDSNLDLPLDRQVFTTAKDVKTVVATLAPPEREKAEALRQMGVHVWQMPSQDGQVELKSLLTRMAKEGWLHILAEGGSALFAQLLSQRLGDELYLFVAPKFVGSTGISWVGALGVSDMAQALQAKAMTSETVGEDLLLKISL